MQIDFNLNIKQLQNGLFEIDFDINKLNPTISVINHITLQSTVTAAEDGIVNIFLTPFATAPKNCNDCKLIEQHPANAGKNNVSVDIKNAAERYLQQGIKILYARISPLSPSVITDDINVVVSAEALLPNNLVNYEQKTQANISTNSEFGQTNVNLRDGNFSFAHTDWMFNGGGTAFNLQHIYRNVSNASDEFITGLHTGCGNGWKTNFHQYLIGEGETAFYIDASGDVHTFKQSSGVIYDASGLGLKLETVGSCKKLFDDAGNTMHFAADGKLCRIDTVWGNEIYVTYENDLIKQIYNGNEYATFYYNADGLLDTVSYSAAAEKLKFNYSNGQLTKISKNKDNSEDIQAMFTYSADGNLTQIYSGDYAKLTIAYDGAKKVSRLTSAAMDGTAIMSYNKFSYEADNVRYVEDNNGVKFKYTIKGNGDVSRIDEVLQDNSLHKIYPQENATDKATEYTYLYAIELKDVISMTDERTGSIICFNENENTFTERDVMFSLYSLYKNNGTLDFSYNDGKDKIFGIPKENCKITSKNNTVITLNADCFSKKTVIKDDNGAELLHVINNYSFEAGGQKTITTVKAAYNNSVVSTDYSLKNYKGQLVSSTQDGITTEYTYDKFGNVTKTTVKQGNTVVATTSAKYSANGEYMTQETDALNNVTKYENILPYNILQKVINPNNSYVKYNHDAFNENLKNVIFDNKKVSYYDRVGTYDDKIINALYTNKNRISQVKCGNNTYYLTYNGAGDLAKVEVNGMGTTLLNKSYNYGNRSETIFFSDGYTEKHTYNKYGNLSTIIANNDQKFVATYSDKNGKFSCDAKLKESTDYYADRKTVQSKNTDGSAAFNCYSAKTHAKLYGKQNIVRGNDTFSAYSFTNGIKNIAYYRRLIDDFGKPINKLQIIESVETKANPFVCDYTKDSLKRTTAKVFTLPKNNVQITQTCSYANNVGMVAEDTATYNKSNNEKKSRHYVYDSLGNITDITIKKEVNTKTETQRIYYKYDNLNRLIQERNETIDKTVNYAYDDQGNITSKTISTYNGQNPQTITYDYTANYKDLLTSYDGKSIVYSSGTGYPTDYFGRQLTWERGLLKQFVIPQEGVKLGFTYNFTYDAFGKKVKKTVNNFVYQYYYDGDTLIGEDKFFNGSIQLSLRYLYDDRGICGVKANRTNAEGGVVYHVTRDSLGNVVRMDDHNGIVMEVNYDAFGKPTFTTDKILGDVGNFYASQLIPFLFKGYYYDYDLKLYYLLSRYYDPETGRFISPDSIDYFKPVTVGGTNLYSYCNNNPVMFVDPTGHLAVFISILLAGIIGSAAISGGINIVTQLIDNGGDYVSLDWGQILNRVIVGAALGAATALGITSLGPAIAGAVSISGLSAISAFGISSAITFGAGALGYATEEWINGKTPSFGKAIMHGAFVMSEGMLTYGFSGMMGSVGTIGKKGVGIEKILKTLFIQEFTLPYKVVTDIIRRLL